MAHRIETPSSASKASTNLKNMNTKSFLKTNINEYLKDDPNSCINCQNCMKVKNKPLHYKYSKQIQSSYAA